jgi:hypothetical protein
MYKKPGITIDALSVDLDGWEEMSRTDEEIVWWQESPQVGRHTTFFAGSVSLPFADANAIRADYAREAADNGGAQIDFGIINIAGFNAICNTLKIPDKKRDTGIIVIGKIGFAFENCAWVINFESREGALTGVREAVVMDELMREGQVQLQPGGVNGWVVDEKIRPNTLRTNRSDAPQYDQRFPDHPLSAVRAAMNRTIKACKFDDNIRGQLKPLL